MALRGLLFRETERRMLREVRNAKTGEVIFSTDVELKLYTWLDDATDGPSPRWKLVGS